MKHSAFSVRTDKLKGLLQKEGVGCFLATPSSDLKYLCGYSIRGDERFLALVVSPGHEPFFIANVLYELQVTETPVEDFVYWADGEDPFSLLSSELSKRGVDTGTIAVDGAMPAMFSLRLSALYPKTRFVNGSPLVQPLRIYKDRQEMDRMIKATAKADQALKRCMEAGTGWVGKTESEFLARLSYEMTCLGLSDPGACVAVGANAAVPHHKTGDAAIEMGKCLLIDFGGSWKNYQTDMTRTYHFGEPDEEFAEVYDIVLEANLAGEEAAKAGNELQDVDAAARRVIEKAGYGKYFIHRTGHGIGIDCHEGPSAGAGETTKIAPGMAFSCEPGIYLPGRFGVRIEDQVLIEEDGSTRVLHQLPKELTVIR
ncbi:MAG: aminopeptidase P family protein [Lachnospiraceae bacterium]|jgi:Xaa-Pro dipeptidase|nr:aminopeptidase P family protein [Lachnospiraceae bacterium]